MKKTLAFLMSFISFLSLASCSSDLGFEPTKLFKLSASLKYTVDNNVLKEKPTIQLFTSYETMCSYFDEYTYPYGSEDREQVHKDILENVDFRNANLLGYMMEEETGSITHAVSVKESNIVIYSYIPDIVTDDMAYKWLIFEVDKKYKLSDFKINTHDMTKKQADYLINNFDKEYWF